MSRAKEVGVLVPVRGPAPQLEEALESVLGQDPAPGEVVVIDDGSEEPVRLSPGLAGACRLLRRPSRGGPAAARQEGLAALGGTLVALADADDAWEPGKLAAQLEALAAHPDAAVCFGGATVVGPDGEPTGEHWDEPPAGLLAGAAFAALLFERNPIPASSALIRRGPLEQAGGFPGPAPLASDLDLWLRLAARGHAFVHEPRARIRYRRQPAAVTADVAALAESALAVHAAHEALVDEATRRRVRAADLTALARGRVRQRRYGEARGALREAATLAPIGARERLLRGLLLVPGPRAALGRRDPYGP